MREQMVEIILDGVNVINHNLDRKLEVDLLESCPLYGAANGMDSISLVSLISVIEDTLESKFGLSIIIADEKAMSRKNSPFLTIGTLADYMCDLAIPKNSVAGGAA